MTPLGWLGRKTSTQTSINHSYILPFSLFNSFVASLLFYFNKPLLGKTFICQVERLNVKQCRSRWESSLSHLTWIYAVCKSLSLSPVAVKMYTIITLIFRVLLHPLNHTDLSVYHKITGQVATDVDSEKRVVVFGSLLFTQQILSWYIEVSQWVSSPIYLHYPFCVGRECKGK